MIEELRKHNHLGNHSQISQFLKLLTEKDYLEKDLRYICGDLDYTFSKSFDGIVSLLVFLEIIKVEGRISLIKKQNYKKIVDDICFLLFNKLSKIKELHIFISINNLNFHRSILINNSLIPLSFGNLRNLLIDLHFFKKDNLLENFFVVTEKYSNWFNDKGIILIEKSKSKNYSLKQLKKTQEKQAELGLEAEKFVLKFEITSRKNHPNSSKIKMISDDEASAGYDIRSYLGDDSIILDKYIEVKSYSKKLSTTKKPYFYWSANELETSKVEKENYFLYLVDRDEMSSKEYVPTMIKDPYKNVFKSDLWEKSPDSWYLLEN